MCVMCSGEDIARFVNAGRALFTLSSANTGARYTYRVDAPHDSSDSPRRFVKVLAGPDNTTDYVYLGVLEGSTFRLTAKSKMNETSPPVRAIIYFAMRVLAHPAAPLPPGLEVRHEGRCGRCGRVLTVPESIDRGIGPECAERMGLA